MDGRKDGRKEKEEKGGEGRGVERKRGWERKKRYSAYDCDKSCGEK